MSTRSAWPIRAGDDPQYVRGSDVADLVAEYTGHVVEIVEGNDDNIKLTTPMDFFIAQHIPRSADH